MKDHGGKAKKIFTADQKTSTAEDNAENREGRREDALLNTTPPTRKRLHKAPISPQRRTVYR